MLDTDICSYLMRRPSPVLLQRMQEVAEGDDPIGISVVVYGELRFGAESSQAKAKHHALIDALSERFDFIADWSPEQVDIFVTLHDRLRREGRTIGANDAMIAAHALSLDATLVTNNDRHFSRVEGLRYETWAAPDR